ncbi:MAG: hypothetical protein RIC56_18010 [Pseudomonadales bacterium]
MMFRWLADLRRRKVLRVAGGYTVAGWGVVQAAEAAAPILALPDWTISFVALLLLAGLPVAVVVGWALQAPAATGGVAAATEGVAVAQEPPTPAELAPTAASTWVDVSLLVAVVAVVAITVVQVLSWPGVGGGADVVAAPAAPDLKSVAVLPFTSFSDSRDDGYFADGLTEELINGLAQLDGLQVPGRTSSFYFKNRNQDLREIGRQLGVAHVVEGSVRRSGEHLRVTVQLVSTGDGFHLWSRAYDRELTDAFAIQEDIATHVAAALRATLLADGHDHAAEGGASSYPNFLVATGLLRERTRESLTQARALFSGILEQTPDDVEALAGYARATVLLAGAFLTLEFEPAAASAVAAVERALLLAPDSVAANLTAGQVYDVMALRTDETHYADLAERSLARALDLAPGDPEVLRSYAGMLVRLGRWDSAVRITARAVASDPLDRAIRLQHAEALRGTGQLGEARAELERVLELSPDYAPGHLELGELLVESGALELALDHLRRAHESGVSPRATFALAHLYLNLGAQRIVLKTLSELDDAPYSLPLAEMVRLVIGGDDAAALRHAESEQERSGDRIWRPLVVLSALNSGALDRAREQLRQLEPTVLGPDPDVARLSPMNVVLAGNVLMLEGRVEEATRLLDRLLQAQAPVPQGFDPVARKLVRAHALALLRRADDALAELQDARRQGYRTPFDFDNFLRLDRYPSFAMLRGDARFVDLLAEIEAGNRALAARIGAT